MNLVKLGLKKIGIDEAIAYTVFSKLVQAIGNLVSILIIAKYLNKDEQGYYYTFGSIIAIQVFFELGFNSIITQYAAHEFAHINYTSDTSISGNAVNISRLSSLLHLIIKWFSILALLLLITLNLVGYFFFSKFSVTGVSWKFPWLLLVFSTSLMLFINPFIAFFEGIGKVKQMASLRLAQQIFYISSIFIAFAFNLKLWAGGIATFIAFIVLLSAIIFSNKIKLLTTIYKQIGNEEIHYIKEILPYQGKIAISWISGYFIFQLFNPVLFATEGPKVAGQMGMTLAVFNGISALTMSWINTKVPLFSGLIAKKDFISLDKIFNTTVKQLTLINVIVISLFIAFIYVLRFYQIPLAERFLQPLPLILLGLTVIFNQFVFSWATYLRCHKQEPFLVLSVVIGLLCLCSTIGLGHYFGLMGIVLGYSFLMFTISFFWAYHIFKTKQKEWHS